MNPWAKQILGLTFIHEIYAHSRRPRVAELIAESFGPESVADAVTITGLACSAGIYLVRANRVVWVFAAGVENRTHILNTIMGYQNPGVPTTYAGFNASFRRDAIAVYDNDLRNILRGNDEVQLHGHSAGAGIVEALARLLLDRGHEGEIFINTYGAPSACQAGRYAGGARIHRARWMHADDPVPLIPWQSIPNLGIVGNLVVAPYGNGFRPPAIDFGSFTLPMGGIEISATGARERALPTYSVRPAVQLQRWVNQDEDVADAHDAGTYLVIFRRLVATVPTEEVLATANVSVMVPRPVQGHLVMPFPLPGPPEQNLVLPIEIRSDGIALDFAGRVAGNATIGVEPMSFLKVNPRHAFRRVKVGRVWKVTLDGQIIATADEKTVPGSIVKRGNAFLRALGTNNTVFITDLADAFSQWMIAATSNDEFARPLLRGTP